MRHIARYRERSCSNAALPPPEMYPADGLEYPPARYPGIEAKVDLASLHPGGMTNGPRPGIARSLPACSPEPVIGNGGSKGIVAYYQAVLYFGTLPNERLQES
jgi:hypothetical protein